jgi:hypothetical protein
MFVSQDNPMIWQRQDASVPDLDPTSAAELQRYTARRFTLPSAPPATVPLEDEPFVATWHSWLEEAAHTGVFATLQRHLPQLAFPVAAGIGASADYQAATRRGVEVASLPGATGLELARPEALSLEIYPSLAGRIPVLLTPCRPDFEALLRALAWRNEPRPVATAQGAAMIAGLTNWPRLRALQAAWAEREPREPATWAAELARLQQTPASYQDRLILVSDGSYSGVPARRLHLDEATWRRLSLTIRIEHECTHYFTRRVFGEMKNHLLDELIADTCALVRATGQFRPGWFLAFLGLEGARRGTLGLRPGGRAQLYRGEPPLSDAAFLALAAQLARTARALGSALRQRAWTSTAERADLLWSLASMSLAELLAEDGPRRLLERLSPRDPPPAGGGSGAPLPRA